MKIQPQNPITVKINYFFFKWISKQTILFEIWSLLTKNKNSKVKETTNVFFKKFNLIKLITTFKNRVNKVNKVDKHV